MPIEGVVPKVWLETVTGPDGRIERIPCELCVLNALREALRRREISVEGAGRWRDPEEDLPGDFDENRDVHYAALGKPLDAKEFVADLRRRQREALDRLDAAMAKADTHEQAARSPRTRTLYAGDWAHFTGWCQLVGRQPLPAAVDTLRWYLTDLEAAGHPRRTGHRRHGDRFDGHRGQGGQHRLPPRRSEP